MVDDLVILIGDATPESFQALAHFQAMGRNATIITPEEAAELSIVINPMQEPSKNLQELERMVKQEIRLEKEPIQRPSSNKFHQQIQKPMPGVKRRHFRRKT